jgi:excisionase family DNA binding protein
MLSVTPDAVLKWVKAGKLPARQTAGGHYRVSLDAVKEIITRGGELPDIPQSSKRQYEPCWEYYAVEGRIKHECRSCLVFRARGERCYEVGKDLKLSGEGATCCESDCADCAYYKEQMERPVNMLVVTDSEALRNSLISESMTSRLNLDFASNEYECSVLVESFRPDYVIVDCSEELAKCEELCEHLADDPRIPGVKVLLALLPHRRNRANIQRENVMIIDQPFSAAELERHVEDFKSIAKA